MKNLAKHLIPVLFLFLISSSSCDTGDEWGPGLSGTWNCQEESQSISYRTYKVSLEQDEFDTLIYRIYNFYNLGVEAEVYARLNDTVLTILPQPSYYDIVGTGYVNKMKTEILWEYSIKGVNVNDPYVQARYFRR